MREENKVQFNLKNVHYAVLTISDGAASWGTPVKIPGAVTLTLDPNGDVTPFYADGIVYYTSIANNGYSGDLEMARFPDQMLKDVWKYEANEDNVIIENANNEPASFALLYQIDGDTDNQLYCLYNCTGTRPPIGSTTKTESKEPQTQSSSITATPLDNGRVFARTTATTPDEIRTGWFKKVYEETEAELSKEETETELGE